MRCVNWSNAVRAMRSAAAVFLAGGLCAATAAPASAEKYAAIVVDAASGRVLHEKNADARRYPASLTKMMTLYVLFEDLERGRFKLNSKLKVSKAAAAQAPSKLGLKAGQTITVEDAILALITKSANDAAWTVGENVSGSVPAFADRMTRTAHSIGMTSSQFRNPNGLPNPNQWTTARDMMRLGVALQVRFPQYYGYFKTRSFAFKGRNYGNHNRLLGRVQGVDGIKTGYINASGFNLVSSVKRDGRKVVAVVMGGATARARDNRMVELINAYLPKATRGRGFEEDLIAGKPMKPAPVEVAEAEAEAPVALSVLIPNNHPKPPPRPAIIVASAADVPMTDPAEVAAALPVPPAAPEVVAEPIVTAALAPVPPQPITKKVRTLSLAVAPLSPPETEVAALTADIPSTAEEAFANIGDEAPMTSPEESAALAALIEARFKARPVEVASLEPVAMPQAAPAAAPEPAPVAEAVSIRDGWMIQIGAVDSKKAATKLLDRARTKAAKALKNADPVTEVIDKNGQTLVRARFAGFESEKAAQNACAALKKNSMACYTLRL